MATVTRTTTFQDGNELTAAQLNNEFNNLLNALNLTNSDIAGGAAISLSKLAGSQQGAIAYDSGSALTTLAPGTVGQFLQTQGAGQNPTWTKVTQSFGANAIQLNNVQTISSVDPSVTDVANATVTLTTTGSPVLVTGFISIKLSAANQYGICYLYLDGVGVSYGYASVSSSNGFTSIPIAYYSTPSAGPHTWKLSAAVGSGQTLNPQSYSLNVVELK